jgi:TonB family protein
MILPSFQSNRHSSRRATGLAGFALAAMMLTLTLHAEDRAIKQRVAPVYPEIAKRMGITGVVEVQASVAPDGKVTAVKTVSGNHMLASAAEEAVQRWKFVPADNPSTVNVDLNFTLNH